MLLLIVIWIIWEDLPKGELAYSLYRFVREMWKLNGEEYLPNTVREIVIMLQMFLHENALYWKLLEGDFFIAVRHVLDNSMKERHALGMGVRRSSEVISLSNEAKLFSTGTLGEGDATQLLQTVIYMVSLHCALRGGVDTQ